MLFFKIEAGGLMSHSLSRKLTGSMKKSLDTDVLLHMHTHLPLK